MPHIVFFPGLLLPWYLCFHGVLLWGDFSNPFAFRNLQGEVGISLCVQVYAPIIRPSPPWNSPTRLHSPPLLAQRDTGSLPFLWLLSTLQRVLWGQCIPPSFQLTWLCRVEGKNFLTINTVFSVPPWLGMPVRLFFLCSLLCGPMRFGLMALSHRFAFVH